MRGVGRVAGVFVDATCRESGSVCGGETEGDRRRAGSERLVQMWYRCGTDVLELVSEVHDFQSPFFFFFLQTETRETAKPAVSVRSFGTALILVIPGAHAVYGAALWNSPFRLDEKCRKAVFSFARTL